MPLTFPTRKENMRNYNSTFHVVNGLTGLLCGSHTVSATCLGNAIDTIGFQSMLAVLCVGSLKGSYSVPAAADLTVKIQECATIGGTYNDITDGAINGTATVQGSAKFDVLQVVAGSAVSATPFYQRKLYATLNTGTHKRYIRAHASVVGTASALMQFAIAVPILLGRARDSAYIVDGIATTTTDSFVSYGYKWGSNPGI
jgi:hypothetical protein